MGLGKVRREGARRGEGRLDEVRLGGKGGEGGRSEKGHIGNGIKKVSKAMRKM